MTACACNERIGRVCEFHARAPRPCPECKTGTLSRAVGKVITPCFNREISGVVRLPSTRPIWTCNRCEYCTVA